MTDQLALPSDLYFLIEHQVWARPHHDGSVTVGISELGIHLSGEIYMCRAKRIGTEIGQGETVAVVELAKSIVAVKTAVAGTVIEVNEALELRPHLVHRDPYGAGWIARLQMNDFAADQPQLVRGEAAIAPMREHARLHELELQPTVVPPSAPSP